MPSWMAKCLADWGLQPSRSRVSTIPWPIEAAEPGFHPSQRRLQSTEIWNTFPNTRCSREHNLSVVSEGWIDVLCARCLRFGQHGSGRVLPSAGAKRSFCSV